MKILIFVITLILSFNLCAQNGIENTNIFVRVYDLQGKKIGKGKILSISETSLQLNRKRESITIPVISIGLIKTKRSAGNNLLIGATTGAALMAIIGAAVADPDDFLGRGPVIVLATLEGLVAGVVIGGITILFKNSKTYEINGDKVKWKAFYGNDI